MDLSYVSASLLHARRAGQPRWRDCGGGGCHGGRERGSEQVGEDKGGSGGQDGAGGGLGGGGGGKQVMWGWEAGGRSTCGHRSLGRIAPQRVRICDFSNSVIWATGQRGLILFRRRVYTKGYTWLAVRRCRNIAREPGKVGSNARDLYWNVSSSERHTMYFYHFGVSCSRTF